MLEHKLGQILKKIDAYDYERITFVLKALFQLEQSEYTSMGLKLIHELTLYKRVAPPGQYEINYNPVTEEEEIMQGSKCLSPWSTQRLPFQPLVHGNAMKIISPELNAETINLLYHIASLLQLSPDNLYMMTIKNVVSEHLKQKVPAEVDTVTNTIDKFKCQWTLDKDSEENFFPTIRSLLLQVPSKKGASIISNWIINQLPLGAEKVAAVKQSIGFAKRWIAACTDEEAEDKEKAKMMCDTYQNIYKCLSVEQILFQNNVADRELLSLSNAPSTLIFKLYEHSSIPQRFQPRVVLDSLPDIHKVTDEIGQISGVNLANIRLKLLEQWMPSVHQQDVDITLDMTSINMDMTLRVEEEEVVQDEINLKMMIYLLQNESLKTSLLCLLNYVYEGDDGTVSNLCRVRAIWCLFSLADGQTIRKLALKPTDFIDLLKKLVYMVKMERLHLPQTLKSFTNCSKHGLVRSIWLNHRHEKEAVRLVCDLCLDYHISDVQLWNSILQQLLAFQMTDYLQHIMVHLLYNPELWKVSAYHRIWMKLILMPFTSAVPPLTSEMTEKCLKSYKLIHRCPLIHHLDLQGIAQNFTKVGLPSCALGCLLLLVKNDVKLKAVNSLLSDTGNVQMIFTQLSDWCTAHKTLPMMKQIEFAVYGFVNDSQRYHLLDGSVYSVQMALYLISVDKIHGLLAYLLKQSRLKEASALLMNYQKAQNTSSDSRPLDEAQSDTARIREYLDRNQLSDLVAYLPLDTSNENYYVDREQHLSD